MCAARACGRVDEHEVSCVRRPITGSRGGAVSFRDPSRFETLALLCRLSGVYDAQCVMRNGLIGDIPEDEGGGGSNEIVASMRWCLDSLTLELAMHILEARGCGWYVWGVAIGGGNFLIWKCVRVWDIARIMVSL